MASYLKCPACGAIRSASAAVCPECGYEFQDVAVSDSVTNFHKELMEVDREISASESPDSKIGCLMILAWIFLFPIMLCIAIVKMAMHTEKNLKGAEKRKANLISTYPVPNSRRDLLEFTTLIRSQIQSLTYMNCVTKEGSSIQAWDKVWVKKLVQVEKKSEMALAGDSKACQDIRKELEEAQGIVADNTKKQYTVIGIAAVAFIALMVFSNIG